MYTHGETQKCALLANSILFSQLPAQDLNVLVRFVKFKKVAAKEVVFYKAAPGSQMCMIVSGRVKLGILSDEGKEMVLGFLEAGDIFGEISLLDGQERSVTVTASNPTELLVIERRDFVPFLEHHPKVAIKLLEILAKRLRLVDEMFEDALFLNLPSRLAKKFLALAGAYGEQTSKGTRVNLKLSQQEIGNLVGASRESINKQMRVWEDEGLIRFEKGYLTLIKPIELENLADPI